MGEPAFHALWYQLGPYGRQDVHLHPRIDREDTDDVLVGLGQDCSKGPHVRKRLTVGAVWSKRDQEGQPLDARRQPRPKA